MLEAREVAALLSPKTAGRRREEPPERGWPPLVNARCGSTTLTGYLDQVTEAEAVVQSLDELPPLAGDCEVAIELPLGEVKARGSISAVNPERRRFCVALDRFESRGYLLLAAALLREEMEAGP